MPGIISVETDIKYQDRSWQTRNMTLGLKHSQPRVAIHAIPLNYHHIGASILGLQLGLASHALTLHYHHRAGTFGWQVELGRTSYTTTWAPYSSKYSWVANLVGPHKLYMFTMLQAQLCGKMRFACDSKGKPSPDKSSYTVGFAQNCGWSN